MAGEKIYTRAELAAKIKAAKPGYRLMSDEAVLNAAFAARPEMKGWLAPEPPPAPPPPGLIQRMKDMAGRAIESAAPAFKQAAAAAGEGLAAQGTAATDLGRQLGRAGKAAGGAVGKQLETAAAVPPYAGAGAVKGISAGYVDVTPQLEKLPDAGISDLTKKRAEIAGEILGSTLPMGASVKAAGAGVKAVNLAAKARPAITGLAQAAAAGGIYGAARKPGDGETRQENALNDAAMFTAFAAGGELGGKIIGWYKANYTMPGAIDAATNAMADQLAKRGMDRATAKGLSEQALKDAVEKGQASGKGPLETKDFVRLRRAAERGIPQPSREKNLPSTYVRKGPKTEAPAPITENAQITQQEALPARETDSPQAQPAAASPGSVNENPKAQPATQALPPYNVGDIAQSTNGIGRTSIGVVQKISPVSDGGWDVKIKFKDGTQVIHSDFVEPTPEHVAKNWKAQMEGKAKTPATAPAPAGTFKVDGVDMLIIEPTPENFKDMARSDMEDYILQRHAAKATQAELDKLTNIYAGKVPKEELRLTKDDIEESALEQGDAPELDVLRNYVDLTTPGIAPEDVERLQAGIANIYTQMDGAPVDQAEALDRAKQLYDEATDASNQHKLLKDLTSLAKEKPARAGKKAAPAPTETPEQKKARLRAERDRIAAEVEGKPAAAPASGKYFMETQDKERIVSATLEEASDNGAAALDEAANNASDGEKAPTRYKLLDEKGKQVGFVNRKGVIIDGGKKVLYDPAAQPDNTAPVTAVPKEKIDFGITERTPDRERYTSVMRKIQPVVNAVSPRRVKTELRRAIREYSTGAASTHIYPNKAGIEIGDKVEVTLKDYPGEKNGTDYGYVYATENNTASIWGLNRGQLHYIPNDRIKVVEKTSIPAYQLRPGDTVSVLSVGAPWATVKKIYPDGTADVMIAEDEWWTAPSYNTDIKKGLNRVSLSRLSFTRAPETSPARLKAEAERIRAEMPAPEVRENEGAGASEALNSRNWSHVLPEEPAPGAGVVYKAGIKKFAEKAFNAPIMSRATIRMGDAVGKYYPKNGTIRLKTWGELEVMAHEIAHAIDDMTFKHKFRGNFSDAAVKELQALDYDQQKRRTYEGYAEWFRHLMSTGQAERLAPTFTQEFKTKMAGTQIERDIKKLGEMFKTWRDMGSEGRMDAQIDHKGETLPQQTMPEKVKAAAREFYRAWTDKFDHYKIVEDEGGVSRNGARLTPFEKATRFSGKPAAMADTIVNDRFVDFDGNTIGMSLREALEPAIEITPAGFTDGARFKAFIRYAAAKRGLERAGKGFETGFDVNDMKYVVKKYQSPEWDLAVKQLGEWYDNLYSLTLGRIYTAEELKAIADSDLFYVSFRRALEEPIGAAGKGRTPLNPGTPGRTYRGSGRPIINPIQSAITDAQRIVDMAMKAEIAQTMAEFAQTNPRAYGRVLAPVPPPMESVQFTAEKLRDYLESEGIDVAELDLDKMVNIFKVKSQGSKNIVPIIRNGERRFYEVEPKFYQALNEIGVPQLGLLNRLGKPLADLKRMGATGVNAAFSLLRNPLKDWQTFALFNTYTTNPLVMAKDLARGTYRGVVPDELAQRWKAAGGEQATFFGGNREGAMKAYEEMLAAAGPDLAARKAKEAALYDQVLLRSGALAGKALLVAKHPIDSVRRVLSIPEAGPRLAEFYGVYEKLAKEHPEWPESVRFTRAFNASQDVTVNFTRSGYLGRQVNHSAAFFNASIQGPDKMARMAKENPYLFVARGLSMLTTPMLASWWANKDKEWYKNLPYSYRLGNLFYETDKAVVRVPIPFDIGSVFMSFPAALFDYQYRKDPGVFKGLGEDLASQVPNPFPSALGPLVAVALDKDFMNRPIEGPRLKRMAPEDRVNPDTMKIAVPVAEAFRAFGIPVSPVQMDYLLNDYSGGFFRRTGLTGSGIKEPADIPVVGSVLVRSPEQPRRQLEQFFKRRERLQQLKAAGRATAREEHELKRLDAAYEHSLKGKMEAIKKARSDGDMRTVDEKWKLIRLKLERIKMERN